MQLFVYRGTQIRGGKIQMEMRVPFAPRGFGSQLLLCAPFDPGMLAPQCENIG